MSPASLVGTVLLFARLKLRLLAGNLRGDTARVLGFVLTAVIAAGSALLGAALLGLLRLAPPQVAADLVTVVFTVLLVSWTVVPLLAFGLDDTLDPARLSLLPLPAGRMAAGLFAASATGVWPVATLVVIAGAPLGLASGIGGVLLGILAVPLQFALCLVVSRLVTTALSGALRSRRGRDVLVVAALAVVLLLQLPGLLLNSDLSDPAAALHATAAVLRWTPSGMAAHAIADGGPVGLAELAVVALVVAAAGLLWIKALDRALVTADASTQGPAVRGGDGLLDRLLPDGPLAAVTGKELKYIRREPRYRVLWLGAIAVTGVLAFSLTSQGVAAGPGMPVMLTAMAALMITLQLGNSFGVDGRSLWMNAVATGSERGIAIDLAGRHLANAVVAAPLLLAVAVASGVLAGAPASIGWALLTGFGMLGAGFGVGSLTSVLLPYTVPERVNAFTGAAPGQGGQALVAAFAVTAGITVVALPFVVPLALGVFWVSVLAPLYGLLIETLGRRLAARIGFARLPELLAAVSKPS